MPITLQDDAHVTLTVLIANDRVPDGQLLLCDLSSTWKQEVPVHILIKCNTGRHVSWNHAFLLVLLSSSDNTECRAQEEFILPSKRR